MNREELCRACNGSGEGYYTTNDKCLACNGKGIEQTKMHTQPETELEHYWFDLGHTSNKLWEENSYLNKELSEAKARIDALTIDRDFTNAQCVTRDQKIQYLKDENERMREVIKCCDSDYWFMINLIEHYSTDKDQALKDCLERMKFRKPMFKAAMKESGGK